MKPILTILVALLLVVPVRGDDLPKSRNVYSGPDGWTAVTPYGQIDYWTGTAPVRQAYGMTYIWCPVHQQWNAFQMTSTGWVKREIANAATGWMSTPVVRTYSYVYPTTTYYYSSPTYYTYPTRTYYPQAGGFGVYAGFGTCRGGTCGR